jgi:hypothetical protein
MRFDKRSPLLAMAAVLVAALVVVGVASAGFGRSGPLGPPVLTGVPEGGLAAVPAEQAEAFGALRSPATPATAVAPAVKAQIATGPDGIRAFGPDLAQARALTAAGRRFYLVPAQKGICLFLEDGSSACTEHIDGVARYGLALALVPPGAGRVGPGTNPIGAGEIVTSGVIGDSVTAVVGHTVSGEEVAATVNGNAYVLVTDEPVAETEFRTPDASWSSADALGPPQ